MTPNFPVPGQPQPNGILMNISETALLTTDHKDVIKEILNKQPNVSRIVFSVSFNKDSINGRKISKKEKHHVYGVVAIINIHKLKYKTTDVDKLTDKILSKLFNKLKKVIVIH